MESFDEMHNVFLASTAPFVTRMNAPVSAFGAGDLCPS
jgi:hypothetical protein